MDGLGPGLGPRLPVYLELGLTLAKLGEEARVRLDAFSLQGNPAKTWRHSLNQVRREGGTFEIVSREEVPSLLRGAGGFGRVARGEKHAGERVLAGLLLGGVPVPLPAGDSRIDGTVVAFANLWLGADHEELSVDLVRFDQRAPRGVMDAPFLKTMHRERDKASAGSTSAWLRWPASIPGREGPSGAGWVRRVPPR